MTSDVRVVVTALAGAPLQDLLGIEAAAKPGTFISQSFGANRVSTFSMTGPVWGRLRPRLEQLSVTRVPAVDANGVLLGTGVTMPLLTFTAEMVPGDRPRIHQVEPAELTVATATSTITLRGENLLAGVAATSTIVNQPATSIPGVYPGVRSYQLAQDVLRFTALAKGPAGNKIAYRINAESGAGSVVTTMGADGEILIVVTPAAAGATSTAIAAQVNADADAQDWVTATALVASIPILPTNLALNIPGPTPPYGRDPSLAGVTDRVYLTGGAGGGVAVLDIPVAAGVPTNRLRILANKGGNDRNLITISITGGQGADAVTVSGTNIAVTRIAATTAIGTLVTAINANANAAALITASAVGSGSLGTIPKTWLAGGSGEPVTLTVGGAPMTVTSETDTTIVATVTTGALGTAGVLAGENAMLQLVTNWQLVTAVVTAV